MKFSTVLAFADPAELAPLTRAAEAAGFAAVGLSDHVIHPRELKTPYPYTPDGKPRWEPFTPWPDPWVTAGWLAAQTERIRFYTTIFVLPMRNPLLVAKALATAAVLSHDRMVLGIGVGWMREEFTLLEQTFERRGARADEMIAVLRKLWAGGWVEHQGEFYAFDALEMSPVPRREIPIWSGGFSRPALRRAATLCDGWISDLHTTAELEGHLAALRELRADSPRAGRPFEAVVSCMDAVTLDQFRHLESIGVTQVATQPWMLYAGPKASLQQKLDGIARFGDEVVGPLA